MSYRLLQEGSINYSIEVVSDQKFPRATQMRQIGDIRLTCFEIVSIKTDSIVIIATGVLGYNSNYLRHQTPDSLKL